jgi:hypothetical protein
LAYKAWRCTIATLLLDCLERRQDDTGDVLRFGNDGEGGELDALLNLEQVPIRGVTSEQRGR